LTHLTYTLLIVEDAPIDRELYRRLLLKDPDCDYELLEAETVIEGLEFCRKRSIDAILLDYQLSDGDGLKFLAALAAQTDYHLPPVVMLTGQGNEKIAVQALKLGAQDYLVKHDLTPDLLQSSIRQTISSDRFRRQLAQSEDLFRASIDNMLDCVGIYTSIRTDSGQISDFRIDYLNPAALVNTRMTTADIGKRLCEEFTSIRETGLFDEYCQVVETGSPLFKEDLSYTDVFGGELLTRIYDIRFSKLRDGFICAWRDITERKQTEAALRSSERKFGAIFDQTFELLGLLSLDGTVLELNQTALKSLAQHLPGTMAARQSAIVGKLFWETPWWNHSPRLQAQLQKSILLAASGEFIRYEMQYPSPSGDLVDIDFTLQPVFDETGRVVTILAEGHDITERKRAERDLREYQERLRTGIEVAGVGLARFDYTTNLVALSPEAAALYGFAPNINFVTREQIHATFHPDERAALEATIAKVVDPDGVGWFAQDHRVVWPSGEVRCLSVRKQVFFVDKASSGEIPDGAVPRPSYAILAAIDITERQQTQANLEQRNQELDSFVHIVSHDLKAPLRAVSNLSQWIEEDLEGSLTPANQEQMNLLRARIERMSSTIDGLLDYARIGRTQDSIDPVAVADLIAEIVDSLAPPSTFTIEIAPNLPTLQTKRLLLSQVFANLIGNGVKHHDRIDGSLHIGIVEHQDFYEFTIADDGPGIAPEEHDRVFAIFQAVNPQNRSDSTGIGLAIVKKIVEAEGGKIRLESQIGRGTTFYFTWPK
jgi:PAS domain S-box-containing protein